MVPFSLNSQDALLSFVSRQDPIIFSFVQVSAQAILNADNPISIVISNKTILMFSFNRFFAILIYLKG